MKSLRRSHFTLMAALVLTSLFFSGPPAKGQLGDWLEDAAERAVKREAERQVDRAIRGAIRCAVGEYECYEKAQKKGKKVVFVDEDGEVIRDKKGNPITNPDKLPPKYRQQSGQATAATPTAQAVNANYDFKPGERILFAEDFSDDNLGDFPRSLEFVSGSWEIVEWQGRRFLRNVGPRHAAFKVPLGEILPERFTIEFVAYFPHVNQAIGVATTAPPRGTIVSLDDQNYFSLSNNGSGVAARGDAVEALQPVDDPFAERIVPVRIMVDGSYAKVYLGQQRVANVPNATLPRSDVLWFENTYFADRENPIYIGDIRVAAGGRDLYDALEAEGRVAVHDILFDTDAATIKSESAETLTSIATMLQEHPDLSLLIEGHTDSSGDFDHNMELSRQRAESVKQWLVTKHGLDSNRLRTMGLGSTQPQASNDTPEGMAQNRRVELVKMN